MNTDCNGFDYLGNNFQSLKAKIVVKQKKIQIKQGIQLFVRRSVKDLAKEYKNYRKKKTHARAHTHTHK